MYSGTTLTTFSGKVLGTHQKIDRVARHHLERLMPHSKFPGVRSILYFEGDNGPDGIKRKSPAKDEPWHFFMPFDADDTQLLGLINEHYRKLVEALKKADSVRASFEAAWLAHAVVDGLTPAHHFPFEEKLFELRLEGNESRTTVKQKIVMPGTSRSKQVSNNWKMWGPKGLFTTHTAFEWGVGMLMVPMNFYRKLPTADKIDAFQKQSIDVWFRNLAQEIAHLELYDAFYKSGWTIPLARRVRRQLAPKLVQAVTVVWYCAAREASASSVNTGIK